jgi:hypothetical protein
MRKDHDVWQKTFYHRAMQTSLGNALRAQYDLSEPMPDRLSRLLSELEEKDRERDDPTGPQGH